MVAAGESYSNQPGDTNLAIVKITSLDSTEYAVSAGSDDITWITFDNSSNSAITYLKLYDTASPTVGTTYPDMIIPCPASSTGSVEVPETVVAVFGTAISAAAVTTAGKAGTTSPSAQFDTTISYTDA